MKYRDIFKRPVESASYGDLYDEEVVPDIHSEERQYFFSLYADCFLHHIQPNKVAVGDRLVPTVDVSKKRLIESDSITAYFVENLYKPPTIAATLNLSEIDRKRSEVEYSSLLDQLSGPADIKDFRKTGVPGTNRVSFLVGNIGVGKSLLSSRIVSDIRKRSENSISYKVIPIYIDFEAFFISNDDPSDFSDVGRRFFEQLFERVKNTISRSDIGLDSPDLDIPRIGPEVPVYVRFKNLSRGLLRLKTPVHLFFLFDNLDRYHFYYSNYIFFRKFKKKQTARVVTNLSELMNKFTDTNYLGDCAFTVLMVCRRMTLSCWPERSSTLSPHRLHARDFSVFAIENNKDGHEQERVAVESRLELLKRCVETLSYNNPVDANRYKKYVLSAERARKQIERSFGERKVNSLKAVALLSQQGTRSFIDYIGSLKIDFFEDSDIADRLFRDQPHNLLRLYITNQKKKYRESQGHFPNIFLVDATVEKKGEFRKAHKGHVHTYWLKYLLLRYIVNRSETEDGVVTVEELKEEFVTKCGYEKRLFKLVLGYLNSPNHFRCIEISGNPLDETVRLRPTERGKVLVGVKDPESLLQSDAYRGGSGLGLCFDFDYLQFVIDDDMLSIPKQYFDDVFIGDDLGYMLRVRSAYSAGLRNYVVRKFSAAVVFSRILESSMHAERSFRIDRSTRIVDLVPDFDEIYDSLLLSYERISEHIPGGNSLIDDSRRLVREVRADVGYDEFFKSYYNNPIKVKAS